MGHQIELATADGNSISAYRAAPVGKPAGGIVILQEIFGVNAHFRAVADRYAAAGYLAIAPALFDRAERGVELGYDQAGREKGFALLKAVDPAKTLLDIQAAINAAREAGKVGLVGFCWGGTLAFAAACHLTGLEAAVGYYGGGIAGRLQDKPKIPLMLHFGDSDQSIPMTDVEKVRAALPQVPVYVYYAGHAFNRDVAPSYDKPSADLALERTMAFFTSHLGA